eukprot:3590422-Pyramimonas_sp.AAC.1
MKLATYSVRIISPRGAGRPSKRALSLRTSGARSEIAFKVYCIIKRVSFQPIGVAANKGAM